ncbi:MAG: hypothetical protein RLY16_219, partial [Bacteroidota bacterium]
IHAQFSIVNPRLCGDTGTVYFNNNSGSRFGNETYLWNFGEFQTGTAINPSHFYAASGAYSVSLVATSSYGCTSTYIAPDSVVILTSTLARITGINDICMNNRLTFYSVISSQDQVTAYEWRVNNQLVGNADSLQYYFNQAGNYQVKLDVFTQYGCHVTAVKPVVIYPLPIPKAGPDTTICNGAVVQLRSFDGIQYQWDAHPTLQLTNFAAAIATPTQDTKYFVTVTNQFGCVQKDTVTVDVDEPVRLRVSNNDSICLGERVQLRAVANATRFSWTPVTGLNNPAIANPIANPIRSTAYSVIAFSNNVCKNDTGFVQISVGNPPTVNAGPDYYVAAGTGIQLLANVSSNAVNNYSWTPATGLSCSDCNAPTLFADKDITYRITVTTRFGCKAIDEMHISVFCGNNQLLMPNAFTPNQDGLNDKYYVRAYGVKQINSFIIFDRWGQKVFEQRNFQPNNSSQGWDGTINGLPVQQTTAFVYMVQYNCTDGTPFTKKGTVMLVR